MTESPSQPGPSRWRAAARRAVGGVRRLARPLVRMWRSDDPLDDYALVHLASVAADTLVVVALADSIFFSLPVGEARTRVALYLALTMAPLAVAGPVLVPLLDRSPYRRAISFLASALRAVAVLLAARWTGSVLLFPTIFTVLVLTRIHLIAKNGLTVAYSGSGTALMRANAFLARTAVAGFLLAAAPGLLVLRVWGAGAVLYLAAVAYAAAAILNGRLAPVRGPVRTRTAVGKRGRVEELSPPALGAGGLRVAQGFLIALLAFALRDAGAPTWWFGVLVVAGTLGAAVGDFLIPRLPERIREEVVLVGALITGGLAAFLALETFGLPTLAVFAVLVGLATESGRLAFQSLMQLSAPGGAQGRVFVRYEVVFQLAWVAGAFIPAMFPIPFRAGILAMALHYMALAVVYLVRIRRASHGTIRPEG